MEHAAPRADIVVAATVVVDIVTIDPKRAMRIACAGQGGG